MSSVNVTMTSIFVSGPTVQNCHSLQLKQVVNYEILSYRASLTVTFKASWQCFVLLQETWYVVAVFGSMLQQLVAVTGAGLTTLYLQVGLYRVHFEFTREKRTVSHVSGIGGTEHADIDVLMRQQLVV